RPCRGAALQRPELLKIRRTRAFRLQISIQEFVVRDLVVGVVVDILRKIVVDRFQLFGVLGISGSAGDLVILNSAQLVVLNPEIGLENFRSRSKAQQSSVAFAQLARLRTLTKRLCKQRFVTERRKAGASNAGNNAFL